MTKSDKYLKAFLGIVEEASKSAKEKDDLAIKLIDDVGQKFDEYVVKQHFDLQKEKISLKGIFKAFISLPHTLDYGPEPRPKIKQFIYSLEQNNLLKRSQIRLLNIYQMLRFEEDGSCKILMPSRLAFKKAKVLLGVTFVLTAISGYYVWKHMEIINQNLMVIYTVGTLLGYFYRGAYNLAWGRENLAEYINARYPWFVMEQEIYMKGV